MKISLQLKNLNCRFETEHTCILNQPTFVGFFFFFLNECEYTLAIVVHLYGMSYLLAQK